MCSITFVILTVLIVVTEAFEQPIVYYYCGEKTFSDTTVSVSRDVKFVTDLSTDSTQNLTIDPSSFVVDVTGCMTPIGELKDAVGVEFKYKNIPVIGKGAIQNLNNLRMIKMDYCGIKEIHLDAFLELPVVDAIFLRFNAIEEIHEGVFNGLMLTKLILSNNSISYIEPGAFDDMPLLSMLNLDHNKLKSWKTDFFINTPNLELLSLDSNELTSIPANAFMTLKNSYSTSIRLSNNQIVYIHPTAFKGLNLLYALWLDYNHINDLHDMIFVDLERLYILSLVGNHIVCLSDELLYDNIQSDDLILRVENNDAMNCECLTKIEKWAKTRNYFFSERYAKKECCKKTNPLSKLC